MESGGGGRGWGHGKQAWRQGLGSLCVSPGVDDALGPSALAPILPLLLPASSSLPPPPHPPPSLSPSLSPIASHSLSHFSSSFQLAGIFSPNSGMFSVRLTSDKTLQTENRCRGGPERLSAGPWLSEALIGSARAAGWGAGLRFGWLR